MLPTPYGDPGEQWWYYTRAFFSLYWQNDELALEEASTILDQELKEIFADLMFPSMIEGMETRVNVGTTERILRIVDAKNDLDDGVGVAWDDFTLVGRAGFLLIFCL